MTPEERQYENRSELIIELCLLVAGIGKSKAGAVAEDFDANIEEFIAANASRLRRIAASNGRQILSADQIDALIQHKTIIPRGTNVTEAWMIFLGKQFLKDAIANLQSYTLDTLDINPLLAKALELKTAKQIIEFNLYQSVTRSVVTSWGTYVERLLVRSGAERFEADEVSTKGNKPDIRISKDGREYFLQIKSGPNTMNVGMIQSLNKVIDDYRKKKPRAKVLLGMSYGRRDMISAQIMGNLHDVAHSTKIGRELWDFVSGERDYHKRLFSVLDQASHGVMTGTYTDLMREKSEQLVTEWSKKYKNQTIDQALDNYM